MRWLKQTWSTQWLREPTADELKGLVDDLLNEKVMAREAQEMGLEKDDTIIRRRLAQKLKFLVEDTAQLVQPTEVELRQFYAANPAHFETPGTLSFRQVYFNPEHRKDAAAEATAALGAFAAKVGDDSIEGDRLLFGDSFADTDEQALSGMFGADFARQVFAFEPGGWRGPVKSGYGFHLVLVTQRTATAPKPFETVKDAVLADWRSAKQTELSRNYMVELRNKYDAALDASAKALLGQENTPKVAAQ
ncbi:peptidylprolyl isomerase [Mesorhizobium sp. L103C119B0]|uniref:peptidylprolyl isomerase n=1 Tax=Mesorhizobium sp. L103C119B0 TaxID=1287085 RepID=UPI001FD8DEF3|nr:peptidylprolyl isomerase [Mesorhizobium sp. L103C119B0]